MVNEVPTETLILNSYKINNNDEQEITSLLTVPWECLSLFLSINGELV